MHDGRGRGQGRDRDLEPAASTQRHQSEADPRTADHLGRFGRRSRRQRRGADRRGRLLQRRWRREGDVGAAGRRRPRRGRSPRPHDQPPWRDAPARTRQADHCGDQRRRHRPRRDPRAALRHHGDGGGRAHRRHARLARRAGRRRRRHRDLAAADRHQQGQGVPDPRHPPERQGGRADRAGQSCCAARGGARQGPRNRDRTRQRSDLGHSLDQAVDQPDRQGSREYACSRRRWRSSR